MIPIDGNVADMVGVAVGVAAMAFKPAKRFLRNKRPCFVSRDLVNDFLSGVSIPSFAMLVASVASSWLLEEALKSSKISMAIAGTIGLVFITREIISD